jgi:hypothetical protein
LRANPGLPHKTGPYVDIFPWTFEIVNAFAERYNLRLETFKKEPAATKVKDGKTDLIIIVNEKPHPLFKRVNNDLCLEIELKLYQAIFGFDKVINHLDNRKLHISFNGKTDHNNIKRIPGEGMKILNEFFILNIEIQSISCDNNEKERKEILKSFSNNNDKIQLLFNIKILNECIDIPSCDSIYISYPPKSKITTIQRISRATRKDINNPHKIANVFIWCDEYDEILKILSIFKEYDLLFKDKIKLNQINYYNSKEIEYIELIKNDIKTIYNVIINCKEYIQYTFEEKLEIIEKYVKENGKFPSIKDDKSLIIIK